MRKILVPTDFSENAMNAIQYAMEIFKYDRSEFLIVHAFADEVYENTQEMSRALFEKFKEKIAQGTNRELQKIVNTMREISPNPRHSYEYLAEFGSLVDVVNDLANSRDMDLIVMGTKGKSDDRDITFGSETLQVIKYVKCPVLAVPQGYQDRPPQNILFPTDYLVPYRRRELKLVSGLAMNFGVPVTFLHISKSEKLSHRQLDNQSFLDCWLKDNQIKHLHIVGKDLETTIKHYIEEQGINMLVMVNSRHSYIENLLHKSTIEHMGLHVQIPFLVLQNLPR